MFALGIQRRWRAILVSGSIFWACAGYALVWGQQEAPPVASKDAADHSPEFQAFAEWLRHAESTVQEAPHWGLEVDANLQTGLESTATAQMHLSLRGRKPSFRMEVRELPGNAVQFVARYRDAELLRYAGTTHQFSRLATEDPYQHMPVCGLTHWYLDQAGIQFLLTADPSAFVFGDISHVADLGVDSRGRHFRVTYHDGQRGDWWFMNDAPRLPVAIRTEKVLAIAEGREVRWSRSTKLDWNLNLEWTDRDFEFALPDDAVQVEDLAASLSGRGTEELVGQTLPELNLVDLQQQPVANDPISQPTLLYFWATWAAPSVEQIPGVLEFAKELQGRGVQVRPVNVAESADQVRQFLTANQIQAEVLLDHDGNAAHALRLTKLPAVVVVGPDHKVRAVFQGTTADTRPQILHAVEQLTAPSK